MAKNKPELTFKVGSIKINVWKTEKGRNFQLVKTYKKDGAFANTNSYFLNDLIVIKKLCDIVFDSYFKPVDPNAEAETKEEMDMSEAVNSALNDEEECPY